MKVLIIEDDLVLATFLKSSLESKLFIVDLAHDGERGSFLGRTSHYDLIILDNLLPKMNGPEVLKEIRSEKNTPIIMLTVKPELDYKKDCFNKGADDYMTKPFLLEELLLRVKALTRRPKDIKNQSIRIGQLIIDCTRQCVKRQGRYINLTRKEYILLEYLARHRGEVKSREQIMENAWDINADPFSNTLETHIANLRKKLKKDKEIELIHTFPGRGYKLDLKKF